MCRVASVPFHLASLNDQLELLAAQGMDVTIVSSGGDDVDLLSLSQHHLTIQIERRISIKADADALLKLFRLFRREKFDIVHSDTPKAGLLTCLAAFAARTDIRLHTWTGQPWATLKRSKLRTLLRSIDRLIGRLNTQCYADSQSQRSFLISEGIVPASKVSVAGGNSNAGVDLARFDFERVMETTGRVTRSQLGIPDSAKVIIFIGRLTVDKGIRELVQSFCQLAVFDPDVHLLLVGPFDHEVGGPVTLSRDEVSVHPRIHLVGHVRDPESYLALSDVFCLPSYREGFGTVVIEAAAMGLPAVGTRITGLTDAIVDGETGLLVEPRCVDELRSALGRLTSDSAFSQEMGTRARARCVEQFDRRRISAAVVDEYGRLLDAKFRSDLP